MPTWTLISGSCNDTATDLSATPALLGGRGYMSAATVSGKLFLFGGVGQKTISEEESYSDLWALNSTSLMNMAPTRAVSWGTIRVASANSQPPLSAESSMVSDVDGNLWVFGGRSNANDPTSSSNGLWVFNMTTKLWAWIDGSFTANDNGFSSNIGVVDAVNSPSARFSHGMTADVLGNFYVFGGINGAGEPLGDFWCYGSQCLVCPTGKLMNISTGSTACSICAAGYTRSGNTCVPCQANAYKSETGSNVCTSCAVNATTNGQTGATAASGCICKPGYYGVSGNAACQPCPANTFKAGAGSSNIAECLDCASGTTAEPGSSQCSGSTGEKPKPPETPNNFITALVSNTNIIVGVVGGLTVLFTIGAAIVVVKKMYFRPTTVATLKKVDKNKGKPDGGKGLIKMFGTKKAIPENDNENVKNNNDEEKNMNGDKNPKGVATDDDDDEDEDNENKDQEGNNNANNGGQSHDDLEVSPKKKGMTRIESPVFKQSQHVPQVEIEDANHGKTHMMGYNNNINNNNNIANNNVNNRRTSVINTRLSSFGGNGGLQGIIITKSGQENNEERNNARRGSQMVYQAAMNGEYPMFNGNFDQPRKSFMVSPVQNNFAGGNNNNGFDDLNQVQAPASPVNGRRNSYMNINQHQDVAVHQQQHLQSPPSPVSPVNGRRNSYMNIEQPQDVVNNTRMVGGTRMVGQQKQQSPVQPSPISPQQLMEQELQRQKLEQQQIIEQEMLFRRGQFLQDLDAQQLSPQEQMQLIQLQEQAMANHVFQPIMYNEQGQMVAAWNLPFEAMPDMRQYYDDNDEFYRQMNQFAQQPQIVDQEQTLRFDDDQSVVAYPAFLEIDLDANFQLSKKLGEGGFGTVYVGEIKSGELMAKFGTKVAAVKVVKIPKNAEKKIIAEFQHEVSIMYALRDCINICTLFACSKSPLTIITKLYKCTLFDVVHRKLRGVKSIDPLFFAALTYDMVAGLHAMHKLEMAHLDIKPPNMLVEEVNPLENPTGCRYRLVISDFGLTKILTRQDQIKNRPKQMAKGISYRYASPEAFIVFASSRNARRDIYYKIDVFAFAMSLYELLSRKLPWDNEANHEDVIKQLKAKERPKFTPDVATSKNELMHYLRSVVERCWEEDPMQRPSFETILNEIAPQVLVVPTQMPVPMQYVTYMPPGMY